MPLKFHLHYKSYYLQEPTWIGHSYGFNFINPSPSTLSHYITHLSATFTSSMSIRNYVSMVQFLHKQLGLAPEALDSFPVSSLLRVADLTMRYPPLRWLPILPHLLTQLCQLSTSLGSMGPAMKVWLPGDAQAEQHSSPLPLPQTLSTPPGIHAEGMYFWPHWYSSHHQMDKDHTGGGQNNCLAHPQHP